jgi:hypothetical protein
MSGFSTTAASNSKKHPLDTSYMFLPEGASPRSNSQLGNLDYNRNDHIDF